MIMVIMANAFCLERVRERGREIIFFIRYTAIYTVYNERRDTIDEKIILVQKCENEPAICAYAY